MVLVPETDRLPGLPAGGLLNKLITFICFFVEVEPRFLFIVALPDLAAFVLSNG
jgi:hypothetical protein